VVGTAHPTVEQMTPVHIVGIGLDGAAGLVEGATAGFETTLIGVAT